MFYIYHIKGIKVGCTNNPVERIEKQQGYKKYEILAKTDCIDEASRLEIEWQDKLGYKRDIRTYKETINNFKTKNMIHVTKKTITFKKTHNKALEGFEFPSFVEIGDDIIIEFTDEVKQFCIENNYKSQHSSERYIYVQTLLNFYDSINIKTTFEIFDNIRDWAEKRGIYEKGNAHTQYVKLMEEAGELAQGLLKEEHTETKDAIGDIIVVLTNLARLKGLNIEDCIFSAYNEIKDRKGKMKNGTFVKNK